MTGRLITRLTIVIVELPNGRAMLAVRVAGKLENVDKINSISPVGRVYASRNKYTHELKRLNARINV